MRKLNPTYVETIIRGTNASPYFTLLSMAIREVDIGRSLVEIDLARKHLQPFGVVHGGAISSLVDAAVFWALFGEVEQDVGMTTVDLKVNYLAPASSGKLIARGRRIKLGKTLGLGDAEVSNENGKIVAHGTSTVIVMPNIGFSAMASLPPKFLDTNDGQ